MIKRPISWFLTETGRKFSFAALTTLGISGTALKFLPNTIFLYKYKEIVHHYNEAQPVPLPTELQDRVNKCIDLLNLKNTHRKLIQPFSVFGFDIFSAGSIKSKYGVAIGLPVNFTYNSIDDVQNAKIMVNQKTVNWNTETGNKLAQALLLSEKEQMFAICREILSASNYKLILQSTYPFFSVLFAYTLSQLVNRRLNLFAAPVIVRIAMYCLIGTFGMGLYFLLQDYTEVYYETDVDKQLCEISPEFIEAGVMFYEKLLNRNQALRELMGAEGEKKYSVKGNENFFLRQPRIALVHRKQYFENRLEDLKSGDEIKKE